MQNANGSMLTVWQDSRKSLLTRQCGQYSTYNFGIVEVHQQAYIKYDCSIGKHAHNLTSVEPFTL